MDLTVVVFLFVSTAVTHATHDLQTSTPAHIIIGKRNGEITRCPINDLENCETILEGPASRVWSTVVHGEYMYVALESMKILRCLWEKKHSCTVYQKTEDYIFTLAVSGGYLYAAGGYGTGVVFLCELHRPNSCFLLQEFPDRVVNVFEFNNRVYIATEKALLRCSKGVKLRCANVRIESRIKRWITSVTHLGNTILIQMFGSDDVKYFGLTSDSMSFIQEKEVNNPFGIQAVAVFKRSVYVLKISNDIEISEGNNSNFKKVARYDWAFSISFAYATHRHHNEFGVRRCFIHQSSLSGVFNYNVEHRALLEVTVMDGLLYDARGMVVDTRSADCGYSGPAAVFAMGPDGQLLLSNAHNSGLVHISSLFAGNPVSGAGEIVVEDGVVKRIIACSEYYWPDINLNKQVVDELYRRGYDRADEIKLETCQYTCGRN